MCLTLAVALHNNADFHNTNNAIICHMFVDTLCSSGQLSPSEGVSTGAGTIAIRADLTSRSERINSARGMVSNALMMNSVKLPHTGRMEH